MRFASAQWRWKWCDVSHVGHGYMSESEAFVGGMSCYANMVKCCSLWATRLAGAWDCCRSLWLCAWTRYEEMARWSVTDSRPAKFRRTGWVSFMRDGPGQYWESRVSGSFPSFTLIFRLELSPVLYYYIFLFWLLFNYTHSSKERQM